MGLDSKSIVYKGVNCWRVDLDTDGPDVIYAYPISLEVLEKRQIKLLRFRTSGTFFRLEIPNGVTMSDYFEPVTLDSNNPDHTELEKISKNGEGTNSKSYTKKVDGCEQLTAWLQTRRRLPSSPLEKRCQQMFGIELTE